jgi:hypothetical protein
MAGVTTAFPTSCKAELGQALHNFTTTSGNQFSMALIKGSPSGTYGAASTAYANITGNGDEASGTGYTAGGFAWTTAQNITPQTGGTTGYWSWSTNPTWTTATFSTSGCMVYNVTNGNRAVYVGSFGGNQSVSAGTFTVLLPTNDQNNAILRLT